MDGHTNLEAASTYINNLLLARGLLKNGKSINFAHPEGEDGTDTETTMARAINLINDLVLRRDREAEHRENLAATIQSLRTNESNQMVEIERLKTKTSDLSRSLAVAEGHERTFKTTLSNAESTIRSLKEQVQRMKTTIQQVRAQCANDVRKRDVEMQKLKSHLAERQRGKREGLGVTTININPAQLERTPRLGSTDLRASVDVNNPGYSLKQETTEFLTELCQSLSDENDTLISLTRNTIHTLKELQGLSIMDQKYEDSSLGVSVSTQKGGANGHATTLPTSCDELSSEMTVVLGHLRTLLTNPSFVPLEEVEVRDEEILRLREGWEKMQNRWREAVAMMDGWHQRISDGGDYLDPEELRKGMELGRSIGPGRELVTENFDDGLSLSSTSEGEEGADDDEEAEEQDIAMDDLQKKPAPPSKSILAKPPIRALGERNGNISSKASPRKVSFHDESLGSSRDDVPEDEPVLIKAHTSEAVTQRAGRRKTSSKIPRQTSGPGLSVSEKLAVVEAEARAAEEKRKQEESRKRSRPTKEQKKSRNGRRRSTLTHDELEHLMGVSAD